MANQYIHAHPDAEAFLGAQNQRVAQQRAGSDWDSTFVNTAIPIVAGALAGGGAAGAFGGEAGGAAAGAEGGGAGAGGGAGGGEALMPAAITEGDPTFGGTLQQTGPGTFAAPAALPSGAGGAPDPNDPNATPAGGGASMISAATPMSALDPETATLLGITPDAGGFASAGEFGSTSMGAMPGGAPTFGAEVLDPGLAAGDYTAGSEMTGAGADYGARGAAEEGGGFAKGSELLKKLGISPATAAMLGISGVQAFSTPKLPAAAQKLQAGAGPAADAAQSVIQSGGTSSPAFATQKASIDAGIDQQIQQQTEAIVQQAQNSGQGADSQVTIQQVNKLKTQLETQRQALYAQAAQQNVQAALQSLGISDQALAQVANAQFASSNQAKSSAANTAQMALMLQALSRDKEKVVGTNG